jgi:hypothetical protein
LTIIPRGRMPNPEARLLKVANRGRLAQLVSKTIRVSYVHLKPPFHFMQNGAGNAGGLRPTATGAFKSSNNLMLAKDACSSFGDMPFGISKVPLCRGAVHETPLAGHLVASATRSKRGATNPRRPTKRQIAIYSKLSRLRRPITTLSTNTESSSGRS